MSALPIPIGQSAPKAEQPVEITKDMLLDDYGEIIRSLITKEIDEDIEPERWIQVTQALRNLLYWQAKQYLKLSFRPDESVGFSPVGLPSPSANDGKEGPAAFRYVFNVTRSDGAKFVAVLGQRAPHVIMVADDTEDEGSEEKSTLANAAARHFKDKLSIDRRQKDVARHIWRTGPCFAYTPFVTNGPKYGWNELPVMNGLAKTAVGPQGYRCPECGGLSEEPYCEKCNQPLSATSYEQAAELEVPSMAGTKKFAKGNIELHLATILEVTWPQHAKAIDECEWLCYERSIHRAKLLAIYGQTKPGMTSKQLERIQKLRETILSDSDENLTGGKQAAADAQEIILKQTVSTGQRKNQRRFSLYWLRPEWYELLKVPVSVRDGLYEQYPHGLKTTMIGGRLADIEHEAMDDVWAVFKTGTDEKILADPLCTDLIPGQDIINHFLNLIIETILRGIPKTIVDATLLDRKSIEENPASPAEIVFARKSAGGGNFQDRMAQLPMATFHGQTVEVLKLIREMTRELDGILEQIFGGGEPTNTWRDAEMRKNQALMQLGTAYDEMQAGWEQVYENILGQMAKYSSDVIKVPSEEIEGAVDTVDFSIFDGSGYHAEAQEGIPMTHSEEVDRLIYFSTQAPTIAQSLELSSDLNQERMWELLKVRGFKSRRLMQRAKFKTFYLPQLLKGTPIQQPNPMTGEMEDAPSIQPDSFEDDQSYIAQLARDYCDGKGGLALRESNPLAYRNVKAFGLAAQRMAAPPPQPALPAPGPQKAPGHGGPLAAAGKPAHGPGQTSPGPDHAIPGGPTPPVGPMVAPAGSGPGMGH